MKKLKILVIVILMIIPIVYSNSNNNKTFIVNGIKYKTTYKDIITILNSYEVK